MSDNITVEHVFQFFLVEQHGRNQISIFCHQSPMTRYVVVNFLMNWNILIIVADISTQVILMSICCLCSPHWQRLHFSQSSCKYCARSYFLQRFDLLVKQVWLFRVVRSLRFDHVIVFTRPNSLANWFQSSRLIWCALQFYLFNGNKASSWMYDKDKNVHHSKSCNCQT